MRIGKWNILPWNKYNTIPRLVFIVLVLGWLLGSIFAVCNEYRIVRAIRQEQQEQQEQLRYQQERLRRQAAYERQLLEEEAARNNVQNAVDSFKTKGE